MAPTDRTIDPINLAFQITTAAGITRTAPQSTTLAVQHGKLLAVELLIPPGHMGATGFALALSGTTIVPFGTAFGWIVGDDDRVTFDVEVEVDTKLVALTFNEGNYSHTHFVRAVIRSIQPRAGFVVPTLASAAALSS